MSRIKVFQLVSPKKEREPMLFRQEWQKDLIPEAGIWEVSVPILEMNSESPLYTLKCIAPLDNRFHYGDTVRVREVLIEKLFDRVKIVREELAGGKDTTNTESTPKE